MLRRCARSKRRWVSQLGSRSHSRVVAVLFARLPWRAGYAAATVCPGKQHRALSRVCRLTRQSTGRAPAGRVTPVISNVRHHVSLRGMHRSLSAFALRTWATPQRAVRPASLAASARLSLFVAALSKVNAAPEFTGLKNTGACSSGYGVQVLQAPIKAVHSSANPNTEARRAGFGLLASGATQRTMRAGRVSSGARSNPSINRTRNGGSRLLASVASVAPLRAGYLKR